MRKVKLPLLALFACQVWMVHCSTQSEEQMVYDTVNELFLATDRQDWPAVENVFADEVFFDMSSLTGNPAITLSPREITQGWDQGLKGLEAVHHQTGNYRIRVNGSEAQVFCYGTATHYLTTRSGRNTRTFVGSYDFGLTRIHKAWKIKSFKFNFKFMEGNPNLEKDV